MSKGIDKVLMQRKDVHEFVIIDVLYVINIKTNMINIG